MYMYLTPSRLTFGAEQTLQIQLHTGNRLLVGFELSSVTRNLNQKFRRHLRT